MATSYEPDPPSLSEVGISENFEGKIGRRSSKFFYSLPYAKRVILLRRTENMVTTSTEFGHNLAIELDLPVTSVTSWLSRKRLKNLRIFGRPELTAEKVHLLQELFADSSELSEERALLLGHELELPVDLIYGWFEQQKNAGQMVYVSDDEQELPAAEVTLVVSSDDEYVGNEENPDENDRFQFSEKVAARIARYRMKFFYSLPYSKQIVLLQQSRYLTMHQTNLAKRLARRLRLPYENVSSWLSRKRYRNLRLLQSSKLSEEQQSLLEDEFELSPELSEERALMLSYELVLPTDKIQEWFKFRRLKASGEPKA